MVVSLREPIQIFAQAYYAKLLVLPWNQSWDYSFESLPMLTVLEDSIALGQTAKGRSFPARPRVPTQFAKFAEEVLSSST